MEDYTTPYDRLLSVGGGGSPASYRPPPPSPHHVGSAGTAGVGGSGGLGVGAAPVFGELHAASARLQASPSSAESVYTARYMAAGATASLPFLGGLYSNSVSTASSPLGGPPSPYRTSGGTTPSGLVNTRTFWPPTPPPDAAYARCGVGGGYYPMFSSMSPLVSSSDITFGCQNLLPRLPSASSPFAHLLSSHKDAPYLPLRLSSPVTPTHPLSLPYLHLPNPSLDHRYPSTPGLYSPLSLHGIKGNLQDHPQPRHADLDIKPNEKIIKSEPLVQSNGLDKELFHVRAEPLVEVKRSCKSSAKVANVKAREKHDAKKDELKKLPALSPSQNRSKTSPIIPVMTATVSPCVVSSNHSSTSSSKVDHTSVKCSKCSSSVPEEDFTERLAKEDCNPLTQDVSVCVTVKSPPTVGVPVSHTTVTTVANTGSAGTVPVTATCTIPTASTVKSMETSPVTNPVQVTTPELETKPLVHSLPVTECKEKPLVTKCPTPKLDLQASVSPKVTPVSTPPQSEPVEEVQEELLDKEQDEPPPPPEGASFRTPLECPRVTSVESHVSTVCTFSSWVHHQTSVTSVIKQDHQESDSCLHAVQSQTTVVNLSMDKGLPERPKTAQSAKSERTLILQMQNTHKAQHLKCHQVKESTEEINCSILNKNSKPSSKCGITSDNSSTVGKETSVLQHQAINLSMDRSKSPLKECSPLVGVQQSNNNVVNCDIKIKAESTATQSLDALTKLAKSPSSVASGSPTVSWNTSVNKVKPSSIVSCIQSETLQTTATLRKGVELAHPCSPLATAQIVSSPRSQQIDCRSDPPIIKECSRRNESKFIKISHIPSGHELSNNSTVSGPSNSITSIVPSSIPVGIAVAQLRQDSSTVSIKKAIVRANNMDEKHSYQVPTILDKSTKRYIKASINPAVDTTMIVNPSHNLGQWDSNSAVVRPATLSGSWLAPAAPVVTPTVWLGPSYQGGAPQTTTCIGQPLGSLVEAAPTTNTLAPPVGYHLARDPMSGHLFLIPAPNIDIVDRSSIWSTYSPNPVQQVISHFPTTLNGTKKELKPLLEAQHILDKPDLPIIQPRLVPADQTLTQEIKEIKGINTAVQSSVTSITVQTGQPFAFPGFTTTSQPTLSYFYDQPTIVHIAQSQTVAPSLPTVTQIQTEPGKRSQGTSPLNPVSPSPPPQHCSQASEYESDADSMPGSETSNKAFVGGVTASCQVDMDAYTNSNDTDYEERSVQVFDSGIQTDMLLETFKEEQEDSSFPTPQLVVREDDLDDVEKHTEPLQLHLEDVKEESLEPIISAAIDTEEEDSAAPVIPTESKPVIDFIDQHGLNLLVDSIEEFASREQIESTQDSISINRSPQKRPDTASELFDNLIKPKETYTIDPSCTDGLGLLCALAEQRFLEETKNCDEENYPNVSRARSCSPEAFHVEVHPAVCRQSSSLNPSRGSHSGSRCQSPVLLNPAELEMRFKLAELQRQYKLKQKELAKLKPRKDRDSSSSESSASHAHWPSSRYPHSSDEGYRKKKSKSSCNLQPESGVTPKTTKRKESTETQMAQYVPEEAADPNTNITAREEPTEVISMEPPKDVAPISVVETTPVRPFPNLTNITTNKPARTKLQGKSFHERMEKTVSSPLQSKPEKNNNLFQLWKEKKLEELTKGISMKYTLPRKQKPNSLELTSSRNYQVMTTAEAPLKPTNGKTDLSMLADCAWIKGEDSKRKADCLEEHVEVESAEKKQKLDSDDPTPEQNDESSTHEVVDTSAVMPDKQIEVEKEEKERERHQSTGNAGLDQTPKPKKREKRLSISSDDVWNRRRSERIFLHDAGVILPSSLSYTGTGPNPANSKTNSGSSTPSHADVSRGGKVQEVKKKMTRKELGLKKLKLKEEERQSQMPLEMFMAFRQCRLNELGLQGMPGLNATTTSSQDDSSGSEGDVPLSVLLLQEKRNFFIPDLPSCQMQSADLRDCQRVLMEEDGLYYAGYVTAIQAPDVYGITLDRERGNRPHIFSREEMLEQTVKEVKPVHVKQIPEGTRVCAYWSQQYRCLYPGTVTNGNNDVSVKEKNTVFVEFDDGDSGRIPLEDVRLLIPDPDALLSTSDDGEHDSSSSNEMSQSQAEAETEQTQVEKQDPVEASEANIDVQCNEEKSESTQPLEKSLENIPLKVKGKSKSDKKNKVKSDLGSFKAQVLAKVKADLGARLKKKVKTKSDKSGSKAAKSKLVPKIKVKSGKSKIKTDPTDAVISLVPDKIAEEKIPQDPVEELLHMESVVVKPTDDNNNNNVVKPKKTKKAKLEGKKISKLKKNSFLLKKPKHRFTDSTEINPVGLKSSIVEKIKNSLKKSRKNKSENKDKIKSEKMSGDKGESGDSVDGKVKKKKKHKADHKHHHRHHKRHCHHHHKKHKHKNEGLGVVSSHPGSPVLTISVNHDPKSTLLSGDESKMDTPMCCISPGRSELTVTIKSSPPYTSPDGVRTMSAETVSFSHAEAKERAKSREQAQFEFPEASSLKQTADVCALVKKEDSKKEVSSETKNPKKRKERKISCEKSKIAAFLPARQLWRWSGKSFKRPGTKGKAKKEYFKAITRGKETISVGDCAVFLSTGRPHLPYVGRIETMWQSWGGNTVVKVTWFYHPEETKGGKKLAHPKGALFQSPHVDENDVQTISHKCEVLSFQEYQKWAEKRSTGSKNSFENEDVYYLAGNYEPLSKVLTLEPGIS